MALIDEIYSRAKRLNKSIVLPEANDLRILQAAQLLTTSRLARIILIGKETEILSTAEKNRINLSGVKIIEPQKHARLSEYIHKYEERRARKGVSKQMASNLMHDDYPFFGAMMVAMGDADGMVSGADHLTSHTIKAAIHCVGTSKEIQVLSSYFIIILSDHNFGEDGVLLYADCAIIPDPNSAELAEIAVATANSFKKLLRKTPNVAMLSFSTKGNSDKPMLKKIKDATNLARQKKPDLAIDGEMQVDAALVPEVGRKKAPGSSVAGKANVLIFPDLNAGNIAYKLTQRLAHAKAIGPIFQGVAKPINDLSRGCSVQDIVDVAAITAIQAGD